VLSPDCAAIVTVPPVVLGALFIKGTQAEPLLIYNTSKVVL
jgi:hypothetical protein